MSDGRLNLHTDHQREIPASIVYEDDHTIAFLDIHGTAPGHTLVVPKTEVEFIWDLADEEYQNLMTTVKKVGTQLRSVLDAKYVGVKVIGTDVPHVHVHLVPFNEVKEYLGSPDPSNEPDFQALNDMAKKLAF